VTVTVPLVVICMLLSMVAHPNMKGANKPMNKIICLISVSLVMYRFTQAGWPEGVFTLSLVVGLLCVIVAQRYA